MSLLRRVSCGVVWASEVPPPIAAFPPGTPNDTHTQPSCHVEHTILHPPTHTQPPSSPTRSLSLDRPQRKHHRDIVPVVASRPASGCKNLAVARFCEGFPWESNKKFFSRWASEPVQQGDLALQESQIHTIRSRTALKVSHHLQNFL